MSRFIGEIVNINHILRCGFTLLASTLIVLSAGTAQARYASIVIDYNSGQILHAINPDTRNYPASLTKMMTLYLTFEEVEAGRLSMDQRLTVSRRAAGARPSRLGLKPGQRIMVRDAILALITKSANDVAVVIAEGVAGTEKKFSRLMTKKARELGMKRTNFRNASGLPNRRQLSTARDMATLAQRLLTDFPKQSHFFATRHFRYNGRRFKNHNTLLGKYPGADGMKTGYTRASGYNLVVSVTRGNRRLIGVIFGGKSANSRNRRMKRLLDKAFVKLGPSKTKPAKSERVAQEAPKQASPATPTTVKPATSTAPAALAMSAQTMFRKPRVPVRQQNTSKNDWGIQVGAFKKLEPAQQAAVDAARQLPEVRQRTQVMIVPAWKGGEPIYRARLIGLTRLAATEACRHLKTQKFNCVPVPPRLIDPAVPHTTIR